MVLLRSYIFPVSPSLPTCTLQDREDQGDQEDRAGQGDPVGPDGGREDLEDHQVGPDGGPDGGLGGVGHRGREDPHPHVSYGICCRISLVFPSIPPSNPPRLNLGTKVIF